MADEANRDKHSQKLTNEGKGRRRKKLTDTKGCVDEGALIEDKLYSSEGGAGGRGGRVQNLGRWESHRGLRREGRQAR